VSGMPTTPTVQEGVCPLSTRQIVDRVVTFSEQVNRKKYYTYQMLFARRVVLAILRGEGGTVTALFSRQSGKSEIVACIALGLCLILPALALTFLEDKRFVRYREGFWVGIFAPTNKHSYIVYSRMRSRVDSLWFKAILEDPELGLYLKHSRGDSFAFSNGSSVKADTASENVLNEGGTFHLIITDETQRLTARKINKELRPQLTATNGLFVMIGTAFMSRCGFHADIRANIAEEGRTGQRSHFEFDYESVIADRRRMFEQTGESQHLDYEKYVLQELQRLGGNVEDESFKMNFRLKWQDAFSNALDMTQFRDLGRSDIEAGPMALAKLGLGRIVAGIDVAKDGDATWVSVGHVDPTPVLDMGASTTVKREGGNVNDDPAVYYRITLIDWLVLRGNFEGNYGQYAQIVSFLRMYSALDTVCVDATGMGDPVWERLSVLMPEVLWIPLKYTTQSKHHLYRWYLQEIGAKRFNYAAGLRTKEDERYKAFDKQHNDLVRAYHGQYLTCLAGAEDGHDDAPDSAALMLWASRGEVMPTVDLAEGITNARDVPFVEVVSTSMSNSLLDSRSPGQSRYNRYKTRR